MICMSRSNIFPSEGIMWIVVGFIISILFILIFYNYKKFRNFKINHLQGYMIIIGGIISFITFNYPWVYIDDHTMSFVDLGIFLSKLFGIDIWQVIIFTSILLMIITIFGGFLLIFNFNIGHTLVRSSTRINILLLIMLIVFLSIFPRWVFGIDFTFNFNAWIAIFGCIMVLVSLTLGEA